MVGVSDGAGVSVVVAVGLEAGTMVEVAVGRVVGDRVVVAQAANAKLKTNTTALCLDK
jgi:hypothetical protein